MTTPATGTESVGLPADALLPRFLLSHLDSFAMTRKTLNFYHKCHHYTYSMTRHLSSVYRDRQKPRQPATRTATQLYHRAVSKNAAQVIGLAPYLDKFLMTTKLSGNLTVNPDPQSAPGQFCFKFKSSDPLTDFVAGQFFFLGTLLAHFY